jgi:hypothetical protein
MTVDYRAHIVKPQHKSKRSILLKGPSGAGKTFQYRLLLEGGLKGLYACCNEHVGTIEDLDYDHWPIEQVDVPLLPSEKSPSKQDFILMMDFLRTADHGYDFVFFDSLMNFSDATLDMLRHGKRLTGYDLWGVFALKMKKTLDLLISLTKPTQKSPLHVIATWGVEVDQDWEGKRAIVPLIDGKKVGPRIDYAFDDVLMMRKKETPEGVQHIAYTGGTHEFDAKVSSGVVKMPAIWADPNLYKMLEKFGSVGKR